MKDPDLNDPWFGPGPALKVSWANIWRELLAVLRAETEVTAQLENVMVPLQNIKGSEKEFSFMAYPVPRLTQGQRELMEIRDFRSVTLALRNGSVRIDLDVFGQINWFYVFDLPELYQQLKQSLADLR